MILFLKRRLYRKENKKVGIREKGKKDTDGGRIFPRNKERRNQTIVGAISHTERTGKLHGGIGKRGRENRMDISSLVNDWKGDNLE